MLLTRELFHPAWLAFCGEFAAFMQIEILARVRSRKTCCREPVRASTLPKMRSPQEDPTPHHLAYQGLFSQSSTMLSSLHQFSKRLVHALRRGSEANVLG